MQKIVICDIDGVLNYYPQTILDFIKDKGYGEFKTLHDAKENIIYKEYQKLKSEYRKSSYKHEAIMRENAKSLLRFFKKRKYFIILLTARQCTEDMVVNTINWLNRFDLDYDYVYFSAKKDLQIFEKFASSEVIIDDSVYNLEKIHEVNQNARYYLIDNIDNQNYIESEYITRIKDLNEIRKLEEEQNV